MVDSRVTVQISYKDACISNESSASLETNDLKELIQVLRETQQRTNNCLTKLTRETGLVASAEDKSVVSDGDTDTDTEDSSINEDDVSPKRAKLRN